MTEMKMTRIDPFFAKDFRLWLETRPATSIVGLGRTPCDCPIARFALDFYPLALYAFASRGWLRLVDRSHNDSPLLPLPMWTREFIRKVDGQKVEQITREQALEIFHQVTHTTPQKDLLNG